MNEDIFTDFIKTLSDLELIVMRHDLKKAGDDEQVRIVDAEMKKRAKK